MLTNNIQRDAYLSKIDGVWHFSDGQSAHYRAHNGTFSSFSPMAGVTQGRVTFSNGYYICESQGQILGAFQILDYKEGEKNEMTVGMNTGDTMTAVQHDAWLAPGQPVLIAGLGKKPELNGTGATIQQYDAQSERYVVQLDANQSQAKLKAVNFEAPPSVMHQNPFANNQQPFEDPMQAYINAMNQQTALQTQQLQETLNAMKQQQQMATLNQAAMAQQAALQAQQYNQMTSAMMNGGGYNPYAGAGVPSMPSNPCALGANPYGMGGAPPPTSTTTPNNHPTTTNPAGKPPGKKPNKKWNAYKKMFEEVTEDIDPQEAGEFVGEFAQGVGFDISGFSVGALFGL